MAAFNFVRPASTNDANKQSVESVVEQIAKYNEYGAALKRTQSMRELAERLSHIAELAETTVTNEADDWFDAHTLKRNMSELKKFTSEFAKHAHEADLIEQRMSALYDDMGHILNRYFEIQQGQEPIEPVDPGVTKSTPIQEEEEEEGVFPPVPDTAAAPSAEPEDAELSGKDELTIRAIQVVYKYLMEKDPVLASRFASLSAKKKIQAVWKLVR